jgi:hypothetical protein
MFGVAVLVCMSFLPDLAGKATLASRVPFLLDD